MDVTIHEEIIVRQMRLADANFRLLRENQVRAINMMGPIGSGRTTIIEKLIERLVYCGLAVGTVASAAAGDTDHQRFLTCGAQSVNINVGEEGCLDALAFSKALPSLNLSDIDVLLVENAPGIISPLDYPLGTSEEIVVLPLTAGNNVMQSYPRIFSQTDLLVINKVDLESTVNIDPKTLAAEYSRVNPQGKVVFTDARRGSGLGDLIKQLGFACDRKW
jgi:hydrogenase nickel incorporation protein HypB